MLYILMSWLTLGHINFWILTQLHNNTIQNSMFIQLFSLNFFFFVFFCLLRRDTRPLDWSVFLDTVKECVIIITLEYVHKDGETQKVIIYLIVVASDLKAGYLFILSCIIFIFLEHHYNNSTHKYMPIFSLNLVWFVSIDNNMQTTPLSFTIPLSPFRACCSFFASFCIRIL